MRTVSIFHHPKWPLKRKLFGYMLLLAALLAAALVLGLILFGRFDSAEKSACEALDIQLEVFEKDVFTHFDRLAAAGIQLSKDATALLEGRLAELNLSFEGLTDCDGAIADIQGALIEPLRQKLLQERCSGVFVLLDATVNASLPDAGNSRTGLYLQRTGYDNADGSILLYRGIADIGKAHGVMPHRKWRLEFRTDLIPGYAEFAKRGQPLERAYGLTDRFTLPGTSDDVVLMVVPMTGADGRFYGICGYEISASYFAAYHAQPTKIPRLTCLLTPGARQNLDASAGLSCGGDDGYHRIPRGVLSLEHMHGGLTHFRGDGLSYVGLTREIKLSQTNPDYALTVMVLKSDYDRAVRKNIAQNLLLWALLRFFAVSCCLYFSRRFLSPILKALEQIKSDDRGGLHSPVPEIDDLFAFLAQKDIAHEAAVRALAEENSAARVEKERLRSEFESAQAEIARLAYSRKQEIDPDDYKQFLVGIHMLTPAERRIFGYYLEGRTVKEITAIAEIKESTLRYHNQNIYGKLGVNSLKQLLRYAALMQQEDPKG